MMTTHKIKGDTATSLHKGREVTHQGLHHLGMHLADARCHKSSIGMAHNTCLRPSMLGHKVSHSMSSIIHLSSFQAEAQGNERELHQDERMRGGLGKQHSQKSNVWELHDTPCDTKCDYCVPQDSVTQCMSQ